ncbi:hypothetical protein [Aquipseudomonas alcaligenes]|uniref:Uncharacterized protein n=1 Tax=Aquipseudomonas alcaligenes TaxID=43263 RepID=A0A1N6N4H8_AQUAC|nr:hypothetical protein [Pseudomonas alcaligenes]SIP86931.1 hypothetical protein SAMN05878282_1013 [Pseudomonas alcaligenes]
MSVRGFGYIYTDSAGAFFAQSGFLFIHLFDLLWVIKSEERLLSVGGSVNYVYLRTNRAVGIGCGDGFFYEVAGGTLVPIKPNLHDLTGGASFGEFYQETEYSDSSPRVVHRLIRADGEVVVELAGEGIRFVGAWGGAYVCYQRGAGVISSRGDGIWEVVYVPEMARVKYLRCLGQYVLVFGMDGNGQSVCEVYDLGSCASIGVFSFSCYSGAVSEIFEYKNGWYFLWGQRLFRFNGRIVEEALPGLDVGGYYVTDSGVCVLFSDEALMRFYDPELCEVIDERPVLSGYAFGNCHSDGDRLVGYLRPANRIGGLCYAVSIPKNASGCPEIGFEQPLYQTEKRFREKVFDVVVSFSSDGDFSPILRQTLAILDDVFSQYKSVSCNPDAAYFSGLVELFFDGLFTDEQKELLRVNCRNISALAGREAPATGDLFSFKLIFTAHGGDAKSP